MDRRPLATEHGYRQVIEQAAAATYSELEARYGANIHRRPRCGPVTENLQNRLTTSNIHLLRHCVSGSGAWLYHYYMHDNVGRHTIIDPTWQQFLTVPQPDLPKVLIGELAEIRAMCDSVPIDRAYREIWDNVSLGPIANPRTANLAL